MSTTIYERLRNFLLFLFIQLLLVNIVEAIHVDDEIEDKLNSEEEISVIVILEDEQGISVSSQSPIQALESRKQMIKTKQDKVLSDLSSEVSVNSVTNSWHKYSTINSLSGKLTKQGLEILKNSQDVKGIFFDKTLKVMLDTSAPQTNTDDVLSLKLNNTNITGKGQTICIIDTGIDTDHSAFSGRILDQYCFCSISDYGNGGCCINNKTENLSAEDDFGHGTHCAGIAAGNHNIYKGVAPEAGIIAIKACNATGECAASDINKGIDWCTDNASKFNISVISISAGSGQNNNYCNGDPLAPGIDSAVSQNILVAIAAGNDGYTAGIAAPACIENATPVGTVADDDSSLLHNRGNILELIAPGQTITSPYFDGATSSMSGTSMAASHVAGAAALFRQFMVLWNNTSPTPDEIENIFNKTGKIIYDSGSSRYYSRMDIYAAILSQDKSAPNVTFITPANSTTTANASILINTTVNDSLAVDSCLLEWNGTNESMTKINDNCYKNKSITGSGIFYFRVYTNDTSNNIALTELRQINITNTAPSLITIANITVTEGDLVNITANASDINSDTLTYAINDTRFTKTNNNFTWQTQLGDEGTYIVRINVTDGAALDYQDVKITVDQYIIPVLGGPDFDGDGTPDASDTDDDNDGLNDTIDFLTGNVSNINSTTTVRLRIDSSENTTQVFNSTLQINITDENNNSLVEFNWNFTDATLVVNWTIDYNSTAGTIRINDLDLTDIGKTVYINKSDSSYNYVCIADDETTPVSALDGDCSGVPKDVACPGTRTQYTCADLGAMFKVSGLDHSAVRGIYVAPSTTEDTSSSSSSGGGSSSGGPSLGTSTTKKSVIMMDLVPEEVYHIDLDQGNLALLYNYFSVNKNISQAKITMEKIEEEDLQIPMLDAYQYFRISSSGMTDDDLENAELKFRISKNWINFKDYSQNLVALNLYDNGWQRLPSYRVGSFDDDIFFTAETVKYGYFAITSEAWSIEPPKPTNITDEGGLEITGAITKEEKTETWKDKIPVIKVSPKEYVLGLGFITFLATLVIVSLTVKKYKSPFPELADYVKKSIELGKTKEFIREKLLGVGWPEKAVDNELRKYHG